MSINFYIESWDLMFSDYLHEKTEESRHNETISFLIIVVGSIFFVGGLLETVITSETPEWFLIIPYNLTPHPYSLLGLLLITMGLALFVLGVLLSIHYARERSWYMKELKKAQTTEESKLKRISKKK